MNAIEKIRLRKQPRYDENQQRALREEPAEQQQQQQHLHQQQKRIQFPGHHRPPI